MTNKLKDTEAYILAQAKFGRITTKAILANTATLVLDASQVRSRIIVSHDATAQVYFGVDKPTATGQGITLPANMTPKDFCISDVGRIVNEQWWAYSTVGCNVTILETSWDEPQ